MKITNIRLYDHVFTSEEKFIEAMCIEHAAANSCFDDILDESDTVEQVKQECAERFYEAFLGEFGYTPKGEAKAERKAFESVNAEIEGFRETVEGDLKAIKERGLPFTLRSSRIVFANGSTYQG